jgi:hypothetical protein
MPWFPLNHRVVLKLATLSLLFGLSVSSSLELICNFDVNNCNYTNTGELAWIRRSGGTPSGGTGPTGDHTSGTGSYVYVESSHPNNPLEGPFVLEMTVLDGVGGVSFWYNMYGSVGMGTLQVDTSSDRVAWNTQWIKQGNQGQSWQRADVTVSDIDATHLRFYSITGTSYQSDIAIDDANVTLRSTPSPSLSPQPTASPVPTFVATPAPTHSPTTVEITTAAQLNAALQTSEAAVLTLGADVSVSTTPILMAHNLTLEGQGHTIDGSGSTICLIVRGKSTFVSLFDLTLANGLGGDYGGGLLVNDGGTALLTRCVVTNSTALYGGGFFVNDGCRLVLTLSNVTHNKGFNGGGGRTNGGALHLEACVFSDNLATDSGGGLLTEGFTSSLVVLDSLFTRNCAEEGEGGGAALFQSHAQFSRCSLLENRAVSGGALGVDSSAVVSFSSCSLCKNEGTIGGALYVAGALTVATLEGCDVSSNVARGSSGGAVSVASGSVGVSNSAIKNNSAVGAEFTLLPTSSQCTAQGGCFTR